MSLRGYPLKLRSDTGSQLVAANKELKAVVKGIDKNKLKMFGAENGFDWDFLHLILLGKVVAVRH